ncbi:MAG TPA: restriction endonuclease subunit S [Blastocatellia bacterium]|jgi:restriction endonuclease S subunit|nr:restriction endonuclease subunit S [Blastocatellia bacterium]
MPLLIVDVATIRSGYLFRESIKPDASGRYRVVQVGDVAPDAGFLDSSLIRVSLPDVKRGQILEKGDVLFISRGPRKQALAITWPIENAIATSQFFVLRPDEKVLPEFLAWYINQRPAQRYIDEHSTGTSASLINLEAMKGLPVEVPPVETQARITKIHQLSMREKELMEAIKNKRRALIEMTLLKTIG